MPFPGLFTLYTQADPAKLGAHHYESWWARDGLTSEVDRGIIYTCRAGFLDLSHVREYMDWGRYLHDRAMERLTAKAPMKPATFQWSDTAFTLDVKPLAEGDDRDARAHEAATVIAERGLVIVGTWHEIATWYGQQTVPGISEKRSAFTWDDTTSHAVAAMVVGRAMRSGDGSWGREEWNHAATEALDRSLAELGAVSPAVEAEAVERMRTVWWRDAEPIRRDLDTGLETGEKTPWLAAAIKACAGAEPARIAVPRWTPEDRRERLGEVTLTLRPPRWLARRVWGVSEAPVTIDPDADFPAIMAHLRGEVLKEHGELGDTPWPDTRPNATE